MRYPFRAGKRLIFWPAFVLTAIVAKFLDVDLKTQEAPHGIISFELAGDPDKAQRIVSAWDAIGVRDRALFSLRLDFSWIPCYSTTLSVACAWASDEIGKRGWRLPAAVGIPLAWAMWLAGALDLLENVALLNVLNGPVTELWTRTAQVCAIVKFALAVVGLAYSALGVIAWSTSCIRGALASR